MVMWNAHTAKMSLFKLYPSSLQLFTIIYSCFYLLFGATITIHNIFTCAKMTSTKANVPVRPIPALQIRGVSVTHKQWAGLTCSGLHKDHSLETTHHHVWLQSGTAGSHLEYEERWSPATWCSESVELSSPLHHSAEWNGGWVSDTSNKATMSMLFKSILWCMGVSQKVCEPLHLIITALNICHELPLHIAHNYSW